MSENPILQTILDTTIALNEKVDGIKEKLVSVSVATEHNTQQIEVLHKLVWQGNGQPSMVQKLDQFSDRLEVMQARLTATEIQLISTEGRFGVQVVELEDRLNKKNALMWSLSLTLLATIMGWGLTVITAKK